MSKQVELTKFDLPEFGLPDAEPKLPPSEYTQRIESIRSMLAERKLDFLVVYGDREHFSNLEFLTGIDPSFEEAILILSKKDIPTLVVGNECMDYSAISPINLERRLWQGFSLLGQPRDQSLPLKEIIIEAGIHSGMSGAVAGWKYYSEQDLPSSKKAFETPAFLIDTLKEIVQSGNLINGSDLFMDPVFGLRTVNSIDQLAKFEFAASYASEAVRNALSHIYPGMTEYSLAQELRLPGMPLSFNVVLASGQRVNLGFPSPTDKEIKLGDPFLIGIGLRGGATCRAGFVVQDASQLDPEIRDYTDRLVKPYFSAVVDWYETIGIGVTGGELYHVIHRKLGDPFFGIGLNPGHLTHTDEWLHSPIYKDSPIQLRSGMAIQVDVIPATGTPYFTSNIEDPIILADDEMQEIFATRYPKIWERILNRKSFMREELGINLKSEVFPFSNLPAILQPYLLDSTRCMKVIRNKK